MIDTSPIPRLAWPEFARRLDWRQGEHVSLIGHTGCGKTTLGLQLVNRRLATCVIGSKPRDATLSRLLGRRGGYARIKRWPPPAPPYDRRVVLWPELRAPRDYDAAPPIYREALEAMFTERNWCLFADEVSFLTRQMGLADRLTLWWQQGRSIGLSLVAATQRPAFVPLEIYSQATHLFLWRERDQANLKRLGALDGVDGTEIRATVSKLTEHDFLYVNTRDGTRIVSNAKGAKDGRRSVEPHR